MKIVLRKHLGLLLVVIGVGAIAAAILVDPIRGKPLIIGWLQFSLFLAAGIALFASLPVTQRILRALRDRSREQSPATQALLQQQPALYLLYSLWFALVFGLGEASYWTYKHLFLHVFLPQRSRLPGFHFVWGLPLGYVLLFACFGLACFVLARRWPHRAVLYGIFSFFIFCGFFGGISLIKGLHDVAVAILAAGLTVQLVRLTARHLFLFHRLVRGTFPALALFVLALAAALFTGPRLYEQRTITRLPAAAPEAPNVLLLVLDTVRAKSLSLYGYDRTTTPHLDLWADRGVVFDRAISTSPWTLPSHGSMFTGRFPHELTADWATPIDATHPTLAEVLRSHGYLTAGFVANTTYCNTDFGLGRGFVHYEDYNLSIAKMLGGTSSGSTILRILQLWDVFYEHFDRKDAETVNRDFLDWLSKKEQGRPFFVFLNYFDAHDPYVPPAEFALKFSATLPRGDLWTKKLDAWSPAEIRELNDAYDGAIAYLDHHIGLLFEELEQRGVLENTLVIVTSDHGEQFGEHGLLGHANSLYLPLLHVPLFISFPSHVPAGRRIDAFVSLRDLPATVMDLIGLPEASRFPGTSLASYWQATPDSVQPARELLLAEVEQALRDFPDWHPGKKGDMQSLIFKGMHYIKNHGDGREELYDLAFDLKEEHNLIAAKPRLAIQIRTYLEQISNSP